MNELTQLDEIDSTVPLPPARSPGRPKDAALQAHVNKFLKYKPATATSLGDSFFIEGAKRSDIEFLRKAVMKVSPARQHQDRPLEC